ncbi:hypothetical protein PSTT_02682 [Puccinia striiformis]|uniref:60S ribosomal protein L21 n=1 Tax=Puccinia striiformis TaxID=27350 RepID=A0A2S4VZ05_9BASI|nr:hypothetical protein PSTT_02682 [Puccinia striiformis]
MDQARTGWCSHSELDRRGGHCRGSGWKAEANLKTIAPARQADQEVISPRGFKEAGQIKLSTFLKVYRVGDIVDIKANGAQQKGMPHKYYHGSKDPGKLIFRDECSRTGIIFNVAPRAVGVIVYKVVGNRYLEKRVNLRIEHVKHSKCRDDFLRRVKENARLKKEAKEKGEKVQLKRLPAGPREAHTISTQSNAPVTLAPIAYDTTI